MFNSLNLTNPTSLIIAIVIVLFLVAEVVEGYKKGFLESGIKLLASIALVVASYLLKNPLAVFLYTHLPFFKFDGLYNGVSALNIVVYEVIAFVIVFALLFVIFKIVCGLTKLVDKLLSLIFFIGVPNKILGAVLGFVQGIVLLYFVIAIFKVGSGVMGYEMKPSLADYVVEIPILKETFGPMINSLEEIGALAKDFEHTKDKDQFNVEAFDILIDYGIITEENLDILLDSGKVVFENEDDSKEE